MKASLGLEILREVDMLDLIESIEASDLTEWMDDKEAFECMYTSSPGAPDGLPKATRGS